LSIAEAPFSGTYKKLGDLYVMKSQKELARTAYEKALKLWPENKEVKEALNSLK
jgi:predicted negative regulator of RcsB-dependent stress response